MNWLKRIRTNSVQFLILLILVFIAVNGIIDLYFQSVLQTHEKIVDNEKRARAHMDGLLTGLNMVDMGFRGYYIVQQPSIFKPAEIGRVIFDANTRGIEGFLQEQGRDPKEYEPLKKAIKDYIDLVFLMKGWRDAGNTKAIDSVVSRDPGQAVGTQYGKFRVEYLEIQETHLKESKEKTDKVVFMASVVRITLVLTAVPILLIVLFRLKKDDQRRTELFTELDANNKKYLFDPHDRNETKIDEKTIISSLIHNLRKASEFISNIAKGNYNVTWDGLNDQNKEANKENLVGELLKMRDQMVKMKEEDSIRLWVTEGISKFAEVVRQNQGDLKVLSDKLASSVAKYLKANQVFLFFVIEKDGEKVLELYSAYAYERKKYLQKTVDPGQGLVGQAYQEKRITHMTRIPKDYLKITSGLGEAPATNLLIVPLKFNDEVEGVIEIAAFTPFKNYEIDLVDRIGEIIASAIVTERGAANTKMLMENMSMQSEQMRAQEEEMRQNMEELQATQEEMSRKALEYQAIILKKDAQLREKIES